MDASLTVSAGAALFGAMLILALAPSLSVITVVARSTTFGFAHGALTAMGVVAGDIVFILAAVLGLTAIAESMEGLLTVFKYLGGAYLVWLGFQLWKSRIDHPKTESRSTPTFASSFMAGLLLTLGDQKAILFYLVFFPAFVDLSKITLIDAAVIVVIATVSVGGAKLGYAFVADKAKLLPSPAIQKMISATAAFVMVSVGLLLILKQ
ncbi:MAG: LysE family translocator [Gammaproteobacteria bacterium]|nr:LysE family translocator [Gammaproteobacteria bacterium]